MQLALSTTIAPPPIPVWGELSGNLRQGFTTKNQAWNPGPNVVNSTTAIELQASLFLEGFGQSHSARYYNPTTGRFMGRDPEDGNRFDPKTLHKYLYAGGDPVNGFDPTGKDELDEYGRPLVTKTDMLISIARFAKFPITVELCTAIALGWIRDHPGDEMDDSAWLVFVYCMNGFGI